MTAAKFYEELAKTKEKMKWRLVNDGDIRACFKNNRGSFCPITAVAKQILPWDGYFDLTGYYEEAGDKLKLNSDFVIKIANAADNICEENSKTRKHLLKILGLTDKKQCVNLKNVNKVVKNLPS